MVSSSLQGTMRPKALPRNLARRCLEAWDPTRAARRSPCPLKVNRPEADTPEPRRPLVVPNPEWPAHQVALYPEQPVHLAELPRAAAACHI